LHLARHARTTDRILGRLGWINQEDTFPAAQHRHHIRSRFR